MTRSWRERPGDAAGEAVGEVVGDVPAALALGTSGLVGGSILRGMECWCSCGGEAWGEN
jgi:hypothetical protein